MAKSSSFFGLRSGSTKSLTFQVLDGKQITKDRVTKVKNPKSNGQIMQRMRLKAATIFQKSFKKYIDRGQEGIAYGTPSYRKWLSDAMKTPSIFAQKNQDTILPWNFPLTKGSLPTIGATDNGMVKNLALPTASDDVLSVTDAQILSLNPSFAEGDQIAVVVMLKGINGGYFIRQASHILRAANTANESLPKTLDLAGLDPDLGEIATETDGGTTVSGKYLMVGYDATARGMAGCAVIHSRLSGSTYLRSTEEFATDKTIFTENFCNICVDSWRDASQRTSDWPEIVEDGFLPMYYYYVAGESEDVDGNTTTVKLLCIVGFNGNDLQTYIVNDNPTNPSSGTYYNYPSMATVTGSVSHANDVATGYITKADFDKIFG